MKSRSEKKYIIFFFKENIERLNGAGVKIKLPCISGHVCLYV